jgi:methylglutaconyl-CoA hydratase
MADETVLFAVDNRGVATITLNRPEIHNAFDDLLINRLIEILDAIQADDKVRVLVLRSTGKSFSAGADLNWMRRMVKNTYDENFADSSRLALMLKKLNYLPKPTIALVQGAAFGGAVGLVACCDMAIASDKASFSFSEVKIGLIPATISPYVVAAIGERASRRYFQTAERFDCNEAYRIGLVQRVVTIEELDAACQELIVVLLANSPAAVKKAKDLAFRVSKGVIDQEMIDDTSKRIAEIRVSEEGQEGLTAFLEKRKPRWAE